MASPQGHEHRGACVQLYRRRVDLAPAALSLLAQFLRCGYSKVRRRNNFRREVAIPLPLPDGAEGYRLRACGVRDSRSLPRLPKSQSGPLQLGIAAWRTKPDHGCKQTKPSYSVHPSRKAGGSSDMPPLDHGSHDSRLDRVRSVYAPQRDSHFCE